MTGHPGIRELLKKDRFTATAAGAAIGLNKAQSNRRANGDGPWSADELIRLYDYLRNEGVDVRLGDLTRAAAADWRRAHA